MPFIDSTSDLTIVAHTDDDLLFMNPDIQAGIDAGREVTTVYLTAGDAGQGTEYWQDRETGIKAAYGHMAGSNDWVDEITTLTHDGQTFEVATSFLADDPDVRLYFLRMPDGGRPGQGSHEFDSLSRLMDGEIDTLEAIDGSATYSAQDLEHILAAVMNAHQPDQIRMHDNDSRYADTEHVDHQATADLSDRALDHFTGETYTVTSYVNYATRDLRENVADADAQASLETFLQYAAYDPYVYDADGALLTPFAVWPGRQYIAEEYTVTDGSLASITGRYFVDGDGTEDGDAAIEGARVLLVDSATGAVVGETVTDSTGDYSFINVPENADYSVLVEAPEAMDAGLERHAMLTGEGEAEEGWVQIGQFQVGSGEQISDVDAVVAAEPGSTFALEGPDAFFFEIDDSDGDVMMKGWLLPNADEPWDADADNIYEIERIETRADGTEAGREAIRFEVMPDGMVVVREDLLDLLFLSAEESEARIDASEAEETVDADLPF